MDNVDLKIRIESGCDAPLLNGSDIDSGYLVLDLHSSTVFIESNEKRETNCCHVRDYTVFRFEVNRELTFHGIVGLILKFKGRLSRLREVTLCADSDNGRNAIGNGYVANRGVVMLVDEAQWVEMVNGLREDITDASYSRWKWML